MIVNSARAHVIRSKLELFLPRGWGGGDPKYLVSALLCMVEEYAASDIP